MIIFGENLGLVVVLISWNYLYFEKVKFRVFLWVVFMSYMYSNKNFGLLLKVVIDCGKFDVWDIIVEKIMLFVVGCMVIFVLF